MRVLTQVMAVIRSVASTRVHASTGVLGLCFHQETVVVCYQANAQACTGSDVANGMGADWVLHSIPVNYAANSEAWSLYQSCQQALDLPTESPFPRVWVSTDLAEGTGITVQTSGLLRCALVFSAAQEIGQHLSETLVDGPVLEQRDSWLEQAKPREPPLYDYKLMRPASQKSEQVWPRSETAQAQLWWVAGNAARRFLNDVKEQGLSVAGMTPDGVALYWGLRHLWRRSGGDSIPNHGQWAVVEGGASPGVWLYTGLWFQRRIPLESLEGVLDLGLDEDAKIVLWLNNDDVTETLAARVSYTWIVFDSTLKPWSRHGCASAPTVDIPSTIALGAALQGSRQPSGDWHQDPLPPLINLLPWRRAWLQLRLRRMACQCIGLVLVSLGPVYLWAQSLQREADFRRQALVVAQQRHQQTQAAQQQARERESAVALRRAALAQLVVHGEYGQRQLLNIEALIGLIPECFVIHRIALAKSTVTVFGVAPDPQRLQALPEEIFSAFSNDQYRSLESWPVLLMGADARTYAHPPGALTSRVIATGDSTTNRSANGTTHKNAKAAIKSPTESAVTKTVTKTEKSAVSRADSSIDSGFVLRVSFAAAESVLSLQPKFPMLGGTVD